MDVTKHKKRQPRMKNKIVGHFGFKQKEDGDVLTLVNTYTRLRPGLLPKSAIRNYLLETLPREIERLKREKGEVTTA